MARNLNFVSIVGQATANAEVSQTGNGKAVANFTIANNRDYGENKRVNFIRCRAYGPLAEKVIGPYLTRGTKVGIQGELNVDQYEKDGKNLSYTYVLVTDIEFLSPKKEDTKSASADDFSAYDEF